jgi:hypothetical protein
MRAPEYIGRLLSLLWLSRTFSNRVFVKYIYMDPCKYFWGHVNVSVCIFKNYIVTLPLVLILPPNPFFNDIHKIMKFY